MHLRSTLELANNELGTQVLHAGVSGVRKVSSVDALAMCSVTNTIAVSADIKRSRDPTRGNAVGASVLRNTVDILGGGTAIAVNIAGQTALVQGVTDEEDALDSSVGGASQLRQSIDSGSSTLRVSLKDKALIGACAEGSGDLVDNVCGACCRVLAVVGCVDGVVGLAARNLGADVAVHGGEAGGLALGLAGAAGVDDGVGGAG